MVYSVFGVGDQTKVDNQCQTSSIYYGNSRSQEPLFCTHTVQSRSWVVGICWDFNLSVVSNLKVFTCISITVYTFNIDVKKKNQEQQNRSLQLLSSLWAKCPGLKTFQLISRLWAGVGRAGRTGRLLGQDEGVASNWRQQGDQSVVIHSFWALDLSLSGLSAHRLAVWPSSNLSSI